MEAVTATSLAGIVGSPVVPSPVVRLTTTSGQPAEGIEVEFVLAGGGTVTHGLAQTGADGQATVGSWILGTNAQPQTVTARSAGLAPVVFTALAAPGPISIIETWRGNHQLANAGEVLPDPLSVLVTDAFRNAVPGAPVTFSVASGDGTITGGAALTDASGIAISGPWKLGPTGGTQRVVARVNGVEAEFTARSCDESCQSLQLLYVSDGNIFRTNLGGVTTQLTWLGGVGRPASSPDGSRIVFARTESDYSASLYLMNADGSNVVRRARHLHSPSWSPDGRRLAVAQGNACIYECGIFLLTIDDSTEITTPIAGMAAIPAWSPDGARIAFVSLSGDDGYHELRVMNPDGSDVEVLSARDQGAIWSLSWSPDGTRIAFSKCLAGRCDIHIAFADGSGVRQLTDVGNATDAAWSPDGTLLALSLATFDPLDWSASIALIGSDNAGKPMPVVPRGWSPSWIPSVASRARVAAAARRNAGAGMRP